MNLSRKNGFSLVELTFALTIIGLSLAAGAPYLTGFLQSQSLEATGEVFLSQLDLARHRAISDSNPYRILLNEPAADAYRIHDDDDGDGVVDEEEALIGPFELPEGIRFETLELAGNGELTFLPSGMLGAGQGGSITLVDREGHPLSLMVYASGVAEPSRAT